MMCTMCGSKFCWACLQPWSKKCGVYACASSVPSATATPHFDEESGHKGEDSKETGGHVNHNPRVKRNKSGEAGVPNVEKIFNSIENK